MGVDFVRFSHIGIFLGQEINMRNRTELKTTTIEGSDYEEEVSDADDSEEDWQPEKDGVSVCVGKNVIIEVGGDALSLNTCFDHFSRMLQLRQERRRLVK